jgi:mannose/fructose/N-acetylgalactosamine-specific phosphotransferase system component IID
VYLVVIAWMYVVLMMSVAEATSTTGSVLGAIVTFILYGLMPMGIVVYIMSTPARKRKIKAREAAELAEANAARAAASVSDPDAGGHAPGAAQGDGIAAVGKET